MVRLEHIGIRSDTGAQILSDISLSLEAGGFHFLTGFASAAALLVGALIGIVASLV